MSEPKISAARDFCQPPFMPYTPFAVKIYLKSCERINKFSPRVKAACKGFWLGVLSRRRLQEIDRIYYEQTSVYGDESYLESGFFDWERIAFLKFFQSCQKILVAAIGGGREILTLHRLGFEADGFECNPHLLECARQLFARNKIEGEFRLASPDEVCDFGKKYDGAIIGWAAYMLIQERERRIRFLKQMRVQLEEGAPLLISFYARGADESYLRRVFKTGNILRRVLFRRKLEFGDDLHPVSFAHWFSESEIEAELAAANFKLVYYTDKEYGCAVGIAAQPLK